MTAQHPVRPARHRAVPAIAGVIVAVQVLFVLCLGYPPLHAHPHDVPIGLAWAAGRDRPVERASGRAAGRVPGAPLPWRERSAGGDPRPEVYGAIVVALAGEACSSPAQPARRSPTC